MRFYLVFLYILSLTLVILPGVPALAQDDLTATLSVDLYDGPGTTYTQVARLNADQPFTVQARTRLGNWVRVEHATDDTISGWVMTGRLPLANSDVRLSELPAINMPDANMEQAQGNGVPAVLYNTPVLPMSLDVERLREIYEQGQANGNDPYAVAKVGDCNTASGYFLSPLGVGEYDVGPYDHLSDVVDAYRDSFARRSIASRDGFSAASIFDPLWATSEQCNPNEPPLLCEYRNNPASVAFIMFGQNDVFVLNREQYREHLTETVERSLELGVIPVLSTFTNTPQFESKWGQVLAMNAITIEVAEEYNVPLINFWLAAHSLPGRGIGSDFAHLTIGGEGLTFDGREAQYGLTLYNLAVLTMLDTIYHDVIEGAE